ncbi:MAG: OmpA family protein [Saprospiraceae bacterium]|nr:OmpA family protein [Saprospiraceae bacterium]
MVHLIKILLSLFIFIIWLFFARQYYICEVRGLCKDTNVLVDTSEINQIPYTLQLKTVDGTILIDNMPQFRYNYASNGAIFVEKHNLFLSQIANYLNENPQTELRITGHCTEEEYISTQENELYQDLAKSRAVAIQDKLRSEFQVDKDRIIVISKISKQEEIEEYLSFDLLGYKPPIPPSIDTFAAPDTALLNQLKNSIKDIVYTDKSANFDYDSENFNPSPAFNIYIDSLTQYFEKYPNDYLIIIGHTDSKGNAAYNKRLGRSRAQAVKRYMQEQGLDINIEIDSKGEEEPLFEDRNEDGSFNEENMAKNRRVNLKIISENQ